MSFSVRKTNISKDSMRTVDTYDVATVFLIPEG
jgi:hypothetical protein